MILFLNPDSLCPFAINLGLSSRSNAALQSKSLFGCVKQGLPPPVFSFSFFSYDKFSHTLLAATLFFGSRLVFWALRIVPIPFSLFLCRKFGVPPSSRLAPDQGSPFSLFFIVYAGYVQANLVAFFYTLSVSFIFVPHFSSTIRVPTIFSFTVFLRAFLVACPLQGFVHSSS